MSKSKIDEYEDKIKEYSAKIEEYKSHLKCAWKCFEGTLCEEGEKYRTTLQEIKSIAEYSIMHNENLNSNYQIILQLVTKAEEE